MPLFEITAEYNRLRVEHIVTDRLNEAQRRINDDAGAAIARLQTEEVACREQAAV